MRTIDDYEREMAAELARTKQWFGEDFRLFGYTLDEIHDALAFAEGEGWYERYRRRTSGTLVEQAPNPEVHV
jgi:hypothetical protein